MLALDLRQLQGLPLPPHLDDRPNDRLQTHLRVHIGVVLARVVADVLVPLLQEGQVRDYVGAAGPAGRARRGAVLAPRRRALLCHARRGRGLQRHGRRHGPGLCNGRGSRPRGRGDRRWRRRGAAALRLRLLHEEHGQQHDALRPQGGRVLQQVVVQQGEVPDEGRGPGHAARRRKPRVGEVALHEPMRRWQVELELQCGQHLFLAHYHLLRRSVERLRQVHRGLGVLHRVLLLVVLLALLHEHVRYLQARGAYDLQPVRRHLLVLLCQVVVHDAPREVQREVRQRELVGKAHDEIHQHRTLRGVEAGRQPRRHDRTTACARALMPLHGVQDAPHHVRWH
mmetsp:Transcript_125267/g.350757  ORF Transcript_125267/g.350757 Transcript_125267/m.350757 type:complete len:340 (-) Transcript_125267:1793-2812(-)